jgi:hypothetical protein
MFLIVLLLTILHEVLVFTTSFHFLTKTYLIYNWNGNAVIRTAHFRTVLFVCTACWFGVCFLPFRFAKLTMSWPSGLSVLQLGHGEKHWLLHDVPELSMLTSGSGFYPTEVRDSEAPGF